MPGARSEMLQAVSAWSSFYASDMKEETYGGLCEGERKQGR